MCEKRTWLKNLGVKSGPGVTLNLWWCVVALVPVTLGSSGDEVKFSEMETACYWKPVPILGSTSAELSFLLKFVAVGEQSQPNLPSSPPAGQWLQSSRDRLCQNCKSALIGWQSLIMNQILERKA